MKTPPFDALVVGSGFAGAILAERLASQKDLRVLLIERREHIGGNMYDCLDTHGILVHKYGPHIFRTNSRTVMDYLGRFTELRPYEHRVLAEVDGTFVPVPFNLTSLECLFSREIATGLQRKLVQAFGARPDVPILELMIHADPELSRLGNFIFEKIYRHYTIKQWGLAPEALDFGATTRRVPVRLSKDDRYFQHRIQGIPAEGYTRLFERMLNHPNISILRSFDARQALAFHPDQGRITFERAVFEGPIVYTGAIDELFDHKYGPLPWRALRFDFETISRTQFQPVAVVNYPNTNEFTRITEFKHLTGQVVEGKTSIAREYSLEYRHEMSARMGLEPSYPILRDASHELFTRYFEESKRYPNLHLVGRLAEYRYYDMNDIILRALEVFEEI
ncbi:MAG: UDP-galactopyranose mutase [Myxococcales bacterium]|nr:UDP-galactopyranose mutase [Myxococcales bacterium]